jgi:hypothetical protein
VSETHHFVEMAPQAWFAALAVAADILTEPDDLPAWREVMPDAMRAVIRILRG